jgi:hypothetical protein
MARVALLILAVSAMTPAAANAAERYALIVIGAAGDAKYRETYTKWHDALVSALRDRFKIPPAQIATLRDQGPAGDIATAANLRASFSALRDRLKADDVLLVVLIGHGSADGDAAKFNIVGPDLDTVQWNALLKGLPGRVAVVNTTGASFPFLAGLSARGRVIITATDKSAQRFDTVFPEYFVQALSADDSDLDKNGRISLWEAFDRATVGVKQHYEQRGQLATERAVLDDDGDGSGKEAGAPGADGALARAFYLDPDVPDAATGNPELTELYRRRAALEAEIEALKGRKPSMAEAEYLAELERLAVELAKVSREIRSRS